MTILNVDTLKLYEDKFFRTEDDFVNYIADKCGSSFAEAFIGIEPENCESIYNLYDQLCDVQDKIDDQEAEPLKDHPEIIQKCIELFETIMHQL